jgi:hypothetical protein
LISIVLQAVGGGQASDAAEEGAPTVTATNIMVAGILFQLISMVIFLGLGIDFIVRATNNRAYGFQVQRIARIDARKNNALDAVDHTSSDSGTTVDTEKPKGETVEAKENLSRWWIILGGVLFASIMIILRGEPGQILAFIFP